MVRVEWANLDPEARGCYGRVQRAKCADMVHKFIHGRIVSDDAVQLRKYMQNWLQECPIMPDIVAPAVMCKWFWLLLGHAEVHCIRWGGPSLVAASLDALEKSHRSEALGRNTIYLFAEGIFRALPVIVIEESKLRALALQLQVVIDRLRQINETFVNNAWLGFVRRNVDLPQTIQTKPAIVLLAHVFAKATAPQWGFLRVGLSRMYIVTTPVMQGLFCALLRIGASDHDHQVPLWCYEEAQHFAETCLAQVQTNVFCGLTVDGVSLCVMQMAINLAIQLQLGDSSEVQQRSGIVWLNKMVPRIIEQLSAAHWKNIACPCCVQAPQSLFQPPAPIVRLLLAVNQYPNAPRLNAMIADSCQRAIVLHKANGYKRRSGRLMAIAVNGPKAVLRAVYQNACPILDLVGPLPLKALHCDQLLEAIEINPLESNFGPAFLTLPTREAQLAALVKVAAAIVANASGPGIIMYVERGVTAIPTPLPYGNVDACRVAMAVRLLLGAGQWNVGIGIFNQKFPRWNIVPVAQAVLEQARPHRLAWWQWHRVISRQGPRFNRHFEGLWHSIKTKSLVSPANVYGLMAVPRWKNSGSSSRWAWRFGGRQFIEWAYAVMLCFEAQRRPFVKVISAPGQTLKQDMRQCSLPPEMACLVFEYATAQTHVLRDEYGMPISRK